jgi:mRNA-degrading endonuclease toxin of MazEF toxin-antitoxin module
MSLLRLIVSADALNESPAPILIGVQIVDQDPTSLLAPLIDPHGWAVVTTVERVLRSRLGESVGTASDEEMEQVDVALRAALNL